METNRQEPTSHALSDDGELPLPRPIQQNNSLKAVFDGLVQAGMDRTALTTILYFLRGIAELTKRDARGESSPWPGLAMTKRQLQGLPRRIRSMATEIERLNTASFFDLDRGMISADSEEKRKFLQFLAGMHIRLPSLLETYAVRLESEVSLLGKFRKTKFSVSKSIRITLSELVHRATGNYHDEKLADLISAVTGEILTGEDLKKLRQRNPKFRKKTR